MPKLSLNASKKTKHTPAGEIPVDWGWAVLGKISKIKSGGTPSRIKSEYWNGTISWVKTGEIGSRRILNTSEAITEAGLAACASDLFYPGTILMAMYGQGKTRGQIAKLEIVAAINQACAAIVVCQDLVNGDFLFLDLESRYDEIRDLSNGGSQENLNAQVIRNIPIPLPPLPEQRRIAAILGTWDSAIATLESLITAKERRKQALMQQLLTGSKRLPDFAKGEWPKMRMNQILERVFRPIEWHADKPLSLVSLRRRNGGLFRRPDMLGSEYKTKDLHELKTDDFLISKRQVSHGAWGIVPSEFEGCHVSKEYAIFVNKDSSKLHMPFFAWLAQTPPMIRLARVASTGVHIEKLIFDPAVFLRESISLPPTIKEQQQIANVLDAVDRELALHRKHLDSLRSQKRGLMQLLLTGRVRVKTT